MLDVYRIYLTKIRIIDCANFSALISDLRIIDDITRYRNSALRDKVQTLRTLSKERRATTGLATLINCKLVGIVYARRTSFRMVQDTRGILYTGCEIISGGIALQPVSMGKGSWRSSMRVDLRGVLINRFLPLSSDSILKKEHCAEKADLKVRARYRALAHESSAPPQLFRSSAWPCSEVRDYEFREGRFRSLAEIALAIVSFL